MVTDPTTDREPPNPYTSPRKVGVDCPVKVRELHRREAHTAMRRSVAFARFAALGLGALILFGDWLLFGLDWPDYPWWATSLAKAYLIMCGVVGLPIFVVFGRLTLVSATEWWKAARAERHSLEQQP